MNWEAIGAFAELLGAVGVIAPGAVVADLGSGAAT